ncbi:50S ribosomal protein L6 [Rickettsiales endosymbiont of Stachyamoeba lipophora]|uniref:50S ribosomal protein L6 n=1 Tax=Rickettsiales endosymbiont of Stachyamoeba lipophora TaxID=2486578 RepID=UPI000F653AF9|nr:50S ribosomal protein L6 [Rickettsiales endosymbiont of Stachyamoeba lipophora]AZL15879.1 50S ribosomal protein L6 [Rickettsiales endosymbiont of Stachyamoeba lipophora]
MSRIGKLPVNIPNGVNVTVDKNNLVTVKGPRGELSAVINKLINVTLEDNKVIVWPRDLDDIKNLKSLDRKAKSLWGLSRTLISNMIKGVSDGFTRELEVNGVGFRVATDGKILSLSLGYSHTIKYQVPKGIGVTVVQNKVTIAGISKQEVGSVAAKIRSFKVPEPYKGKGIKYSDETILRKEGKKK